MLQVLPGCELLPGLILEGKELQVLNLHFGGDLISSGFLPEEHLHSKGIFLSQSTGYLCHNLDMLSCSQSLSVFVSPKTLLLTQSDNQGREKTVKWKIPF